MRCAHHLRAVDAFPSTAVGCYFDAAVRGEAAWSFALPVLLEWLQQFTHQVSGLSDVQGFVLKI
jgi:hypothetical protein